MSRPIRSALGCRSSFFQFEPTSAPPVSGFPDLPGMSASRRHVASRYTAHKDDTSDSTIEYQVLRCPRGFTHVPPQAHVVMTAASHPYLAEANEKNVSQRN